jgi:hypothetical protein
MPRLVIKDISSDDPEIQSLFAPDLFFCFSLLQGTSEVPEVNKPRRACLYVLPQFLLEKGGLILFRALFSCRTGLRDDILSKSLSIKEQYSGPGGRDFML